MRIYRVVVTRPANEQALAAAKYIAQHAPETALKWYNGLAKTIDSLKVMPKRFGRAREADEFPDLELRQVVYKSHRIIYEVDGRTVRVLHVRHAAMKSLKRDDQTDGGKHSEQSE